MGQLTRATQQNASASEELAATSEELSAQAEALQQSIAFFKTAESVAVAGAPSPRQERRSSAPHPTERAQRVATAAPRLGGGNFRPYKAWQCA